MMQRVRRNWLLFGAASLVVLIILVSVTSLGPRLKTLLFEQPSSSSANLTETYVFQGLGFSIDHPSGWFAKSSPLHDGFITIISQTEVDQQTKFISFLGYQVTLDHQGTDFLRRVYGLPENASLRDMYDLVLRHLGFLASSGPSETTVFGVPAIRFRGKVPAGGPIDCLVGFVKERGFQLCLTAPGDRNLDEFIPTWEQMLRGIKPAQ